MLYSHLQHHNDTTIIKTDACRKTLGDFFNNIFTFHFIAGVRKGCSRFACERVLETEQKLQYFDLPVMTVTLSFFFLDAQPEALGSILLGAGFLYGILSASSLDP